MDRGEDGAHHRAGHSNLGKLEGDGAGGRRDAGAGRDGQRRGRALRGEAEPAIRVAMPGQTGKAGLARAEPTDESTAFAPLVVCDPEPSRAASASSQPGDKLCLVFGDVTIKLAADTPAMRLAEIVHALGASSR